MVHSLGVQQKAPTSIERDNRQFHDYFDIILSCGMGCCHEHGFVIQLFIQTTFSWATKATKTGLFEHIKRSNALGFSESSHINGGLCISTHQFALSTILDLKLPFSIIPPPPNFHLTLNFYFPHLYTQFPLSTS